MICNNCGQPESEHGHVPFPHPSVCTSFTARPDEPKGDKDGLGSEAKMVSELLCAEIAELETKLQETEAVIDAVRPVVSNWIGGEINADVSGDLNNLVRALAEYDFPAQDSATREDADQTERTSP